MRHRKKFNHLGRKTAHRAAMLSNLSCSLILHKRINTTLAKAKALRVYVEPLITKSKTDDTHNRRIVFSRLRSKEAVSTLFNEVSSQVGSRPGGYVRIIKMGNRLGDNASMAMVELVDFNQIYQPNQKSAKKKSTRRGRSGKNIPVDTTSSTVDESSDSNVLSSENKVEAVTTNTSKPSDDNLDSKKVLLDESNVVDGQSSDQNDSKQDDKNISSQSK